VAQLIPKTDGDGMSHRPSGANTWGQYALFCGHITRQLPGWATDRLTFVTEGRFATIGTLFTFRLRRVAMPILIQLRRQRRLRPKFFAVKLAGYPQQKQHLTSPNRNNHFSGLSRRAQASSN
tara:strand:- start:227 stop:592 length:366 start_codon:yes stop_codon:yes gene_type:complete